MSKYNNVGNIFSFNCVDCEYNRNCYGGNLGNQYRFCQKSREKLEDFDKLQQENQELKKQLEEMDSKLFFTKNELEMRQKTIDNKLRQQNEFIEWLDSMLVSELGVFTEVKICDVLSKYKEIIGKNIDVSTKGAKNDN